MPNTHGKKGAPKPKKVDRKAREKAELAKKITEMEAFHVRDWCLGVLRESNNFSNVRAGFSAPDYEKPSSTFRMTFEVPMPTDHAEHIMDWLCQDDSDRKFDDHSDRQEERRLRRASKN